MSPSPAEIDHLQEQLDAALQVVLDALAQTLSSNAAESQAALAQVKSLLVQTAKAFDNVLNNDLDTIVTGVLNELQSQATVSQSTLDDIVQKLSPLARNFTPSSNPTAVLASAAPAAVPSTEINGLPPFDGTCAEFLAGSWVLNPSVNRPGFPPGPGYSTTTRAGYYTVASYNDYLSRCSAVTGPTGPPVTGPSGPPMPPVDSSTLWSIWHNCDKHLFGWSIAGDDTKEASLASDGYQVIESGIGPFDSIGLQSWVQNNHQELEYKANALCAGATGPTGPTLPTGPILLTGATAPSGPTVSPVGLCPPCPTCPPAHHVDVAPAEGERADDCWTIKPFTIPAVKGIVAGRVKRLGSVDWCATQTELIDTFRQFGKQFADAVERFLTTDIQIQDTPPKWFSDAANLIPFGIGTFLCNLWVADGNLLNSLLRVVHNALTVSISLVRSVACDDPELTLALISIRSLLHGLRKLRVGTDAGLWATLDIEVRWDQAEAAVEYMIKASCPYLIPSEGEAMNAFRRGWIDEKQYRCWMEMNGRDPDVYDPVLSAGRPVPGLNERKALLYRLRSDAKEANAGFSEAEYDLALQRDGLSEFWREKLSQIRYAIYTIREVQQLIDNGVMDKDGVFQAFRDMGFDKDKAAVLRDMEWVLHLRRHAERIQGFTPQAISHIYGRGTMGEDTVTLLMEELGYTADDSVILMRAVVERNKADQARSWAEKAKNQLATATEAAYKSGIITQQSAINTLVSQACLPDSALSLTLAWSTEINIDQIRRAESSVRKGWASGWMSPAAAEHALVTFGMLPDFAAKRVREWQAERSFDERMLAGQQVITLMVDGLLSPAAALVRLEGLGWVVQEAEFLIAQAAQRMSRAQANAAAKAEASAQRASRAAEDLAVKGTHAVQLARTEMKRLTPLGSLKTWLKKGLIGTDRFRSRLEAMGYPGDVIDLAISEVCNAKSAACVETVQPEILTDGGGGGATAAQ